MPASCSLHVRPTDAVASDTNLNIDLLHSTEHQLELSLVKVLQPLEWHHLVEPLEEGARLLLDTARHPP